VPGKALIQLLHLRSLDLSNNELTGSFPTKIYLLMDLEVLSLSINRLRGSLPDTIGSLTALRQLGLSKNEFSGPIPAGISRLASLELFDASYNRLSGEIPPGLQQLSGLQVLLLNNNKLCGRIPEGVVCDLSYLVDLDLSNNKRFREVSQGCMEKLQQLGSRAYLEATSAIKNSKFYSLGGGDSAQGVEFRESMSGLYPHERKSKDDLVTVDFGSWSPASYHENRNAWRDRRHFKVMLLSYPQLVFKKPVQLLSSVPSPVAVMNQIRRPLLVFLQQLCRAQNPHILSCLVRLWVALTAATRRHMSEEEGLLEYADEVLCLIKELFRCSSMDDDDKLQLLILPRRYCKSICKTHEGNYTSETYWCMAHLFDHDSALQWCLHHKLKEVFAFSQISNILELLFWDYCAIKRLPRGDVDGDEVDGDGWLFWEFDMMPDEHIQGQAFFYEILLGQRYAPVTFFLMEGLSKLIVLGLVVVVCTMYGVNNNSYDAHLTPLEANLRNDDMPHGTSGPEVFLLVMFGTQLLYEFGQFQSTGWKFREYFRSIWNGVDIVCYFLIALWAVLIPIESMFTISRTCLALAAIPLTFQTLQYLSLFKQMGLLVLMIRSMVLDVLSFVVVYLVCVFGFAACFYGLFFDLTPFTSPGYTLLYLFESTLGSFDFTTFNDSIYKTFGMVVLTAFLLLTTILLINLLIAQMSSTYDRISNKSREEYAFVKANELADYLLLTERHPLCMLPAPLNAATAVLAPLHHFLADRHHISLCGTVADYILGLLLCPIRCLSLLVDAMLFARPDDDEEADSVLETRSMLLRVAVMGIPWVLWSAISSIVHVLYCRRLAVLLVPSDVVDEEDQDDRPSWLPICPRVFRFKHHHIQYGYEAAAVNADDAVGGDDSSCATNAVVLFTDEDISRMFPMLADSSGGESHVRSDRTEMDSEVGTAVGTEDRHKRLQHDVDHLRAEVKSLQSLLVEIKDKLK